MEQNDDWEDEVGYKKPPRRTQFKPGQSGNPKGRPKKPKTVADVFLKQVSKNVTISIGGKVERKSMLEAIAIKHINKAATGDAKSTALVLNALKPLEDHQDNNLPELLSHFRAIHAARLAADPIRPRQADDDEPEED